VRLDGGEIVLTGDACYFKETLETLKLPTFSYDFEMQMKSLLRLRKLRDAGAKIFYGHDLEFWKGVPQAPLEVS
jgi:glyoxylase-like metal-dependent hydrolase (beta-lactamase superfamily II)